MVSAALRALCCRLRDLLPDPVERLRDDELPEPLRDEPELRDDEPDPLRELPELGVMFVTVGAAT